jgi:hypothetical protein
MPSLGEDQLFPLIYPNDSLPVDGPVPSNNHDGLLLGMLGGP